MRLVRFTRTTTPTETFVWINPERVEFVEPARGGGTSYIQTGGSAIFVSHPCGEVVNMLQRATD